MEARFIPHKRADKGNFVDVVDGDREVFTPDIINSIDDENVDKKDDDYQEE